MEQLDLMTSLPRGMQLNGKKIRLDFTFDKKRYRVTTKLEAIPKNLEKASKLLTTVLTDLERGQFLISNYKRLFTDIEKLQSLDANYESKKLDRVMITLLEEQLERYELAYKNTMLSYATLKDYKGVFRKHLIPYFSEVYVAQITAPIIEEFVASLGLSKKRIGVVLTPLRVVMRRARKNNLINVNPFDELDTYEIKLYSKSSDYEIEPFSTIEKETIINLASGQIKNFIQFAFWTGMRVGEIFALTWHDIDFDNEVVHINKAKSLGGIKSPKTKAGIRELELTPLALAALKEQFEYTGKFKSVVFHNPNTQQQWARPNSFRRHWVNILNEAGVKYRNPHQMRHTFISYMLMIGNRPEVLYRMVGHENTKMIYEVYGKFIKSEKIGKKFIV